MNEHEAVILHEQLGQVFDHFERGDDVAVVETAARALMEFGQADGDAWLLNSIANVMVLEAIALRRLERVDEALAAFERLRARFGASPDRFVRDHAVRGMMNRAAMLASLQRPSEALTGFRDVVCAYEDDLTPLIGRRVAWAIWRQRPLLEALGRESELPDLFEQLADRRDEGVEPRLDEAIAWCLHQRATQLGDERAKLDVFDEIVHRFGDATTLRVRRAVLDALLNKAGSLARLQQTDAQLAIYDQLLDHFGDASEIDLKDGVAAALQRRAITLGMVGRRDESLAAFDGVLARLADATAPKLIDRRAEILIGKGVRLGLGDASGEAEALVLFDGAVATSAQSAAASRTSNGVAQAIMALAYKVDTLCRIGRSGEADAALDQLHAALGDVAESPAADPDLKRPPVTEDDLARTFAQVFGSGECWAILDPPRADAPSQDMVIRALELYRFTASWMASAEDGEVAPMTAIGLLRDIADGYALLSGRWSDEELASLVLPHRDQPERAAVMRRFGIDDWLAGYGLRPVTPPGENGGDEDDDAWASRRQSEEPDRAQFGALCASALHTYGLRLATCDSPVGRGALGSDELRNFDVRMLARARSWAGRFAPEHPLTPVAGMILMVAQGLFVSSHCVPASGRELVPSSQMLRDVVREVGRDLLELLDAVGVVLPTWLRSAADPD